MQCSFCRNNIFTNQPFLALRHFFDPRYLIFVHQTPCYHFVWSQENNLDHRVHRLWTPADR